MSGKNGSFCTHVGCMDGRVQEAVIDYAKKTFHVKFVDTITEAGIAGVLARSDKDCNTYKSIKSKLEISTKKHLSLNVIIEGHQDCAGNPVSREKQIEDIKKSVTKVKEMLDKKINVQGLYVELSPKVKIIEV